MNIESKKFLANWMGLCFKGSTRMPLSLSDYMIIEDWHPDTNHEEFKKVRRKLTDKQWDDVTYRLMGAHPDRVVALDIILFDLPRVMGEVLTVLKEGKV